MLNSARFIGDPTLEKMLAGRHRMMAPQHGDAVLAVQQGLLDSGYDLGIHRDDGKFGGDTGRAVTAFKIDHDIHPTDPVAGPKTMKALDDIWALPFADRQEWLSWTARELREWNFNRDDELHRRRLGAPFRFTATAEWMPTAFRNAMVTGLTAILDPFGSPDGPRTPSATWGVGPLDLYHCHVVVDLRAFQQSDGMAAAKRAADAYDRRLIALRKRAESAGPHGTPDWTRAYRDLLLAPGTPKQPSVSVQARNVFNAILAASTRERITVSLVWHSFEMRAWRPETMRSTDPRRNWWNAVSPVPSGVTHPPFFEFFDQVQTLIGLNFLIDRLAGIFVMAGILDEVTAIVDLPMERVQAAQFPRR